MTKARDFRGLSNGSAGGGKDGGGGDTVGSRKSAGATSELKLVYL